MTLGRIERGSQDISIDALVILSRFFSVSTDYLIFGCEKSSLSIRTRLQSVIHTVRNRKRFSNYPVHFQLSGDSFFSVIGNLPIDS